MPNKYYDSNGKAYTQSTIDRKRSEAYKNKYGPYRQHCHGCGSSTTAGSAHIVSQQRAKHLRQVELIWNFENFFPACVRCNLRCESNGSMFFELANWEYCLEIIKKYDPERYQKISGDRPRNRHECP